MSIYNVTTTATRYPSGMP